MSGFTIVNWQLQIARTSINFGPSNPNCSAKNQATVLPTNAQGAQNLNIFGPKLSVNVPEPFQEISKAPEHSVSKRL